MAQAALRLESNVAGDFYVDATCIDCDACRQIAPRIFQEAGDQSAVVRQPQTPSELIDAQKALLSCPTASIGSLERHDFRDALALYPERIEDDVYRCGFTSEASYGAFSYLIVRESGNVLIDSPRFSGPLVKNIAALGGVRRLLLTHQDDVADHARFHQRFGCERILHRDDIRAGTAMIEVQVGGSDPHPIDEELVMIPTPGHTRGHAVFLYRDSFLFTGDHLAWNSREQRLYAFRSACWYSWSEQIRSMERLLDIRFEWVLPGHGRPVQMAAAQMHVALRDCVAWMKRRG